MDEPVWKHLEHYVTELSLVSGRSSVCARIEALLAERHPDARCLLEGDGLRLEWTGAPPVEAGVLSAILMSAYQRAALVERVARVSQRGHRRSRQLKKELERLTESGDLVARSAAMRQVVASIRRVAPTPATVLLTGESGVGKTALARYLHQRSGRAEAPFISLNCGAVVPSLLESELFGHERGAFTGALSRRAGAVEEAGRGTLFLDEIAELPRDLQAKLLHLLQNGEYRRVGGGGSRQAECRFVAATNQDLSRAVSDGRFREDLYFRLAVFPVHIRPLRERPEDLPGLLQQLLGRLQSRYGRSVAEPSSEFLKALHLYDWPGNVRELANVLERAMILSPGEVLEAPDGWPARTHHPATGADEPIALDLAIEKCIRRALASSDGRIYGQGGAAEILALKPSTLQWKMKRYGILREDYTQ